MIYSAKKIVLSSIASAIILSSCSNPINKKYVIRKEIIRLENNTVTIPDNMLCIRDGKIVQTFIRTDQPTLVIYLDSEDCFLCASKHLYDYDILFDEARWKFNYKRRTGI